MAGIDLIPPSSSLRSSYGQVRDEYVRAIQEVARLDVRWKGTRLDQYRKELDTLASLSPKDLSRPHP